jgi:O-methyltransferase involved in polyketide biosynthesis
VTHSNTILAGNELAVAIQADLRDAEEVLADPAVTERLDLSRPIGLILAGVLQYISDEDDPVGLIAGYTERLVPGSHVAMSHPSLDELTTERVAGAAQASDMYNRTETPFRYRTRAEFATFFAGLDLLEPGVVRMWDWRPELGADVDEFDGQVAGFAGVGRKS